MELKPLLSVLSLFSLVLMLRIRIESYVEQSAGVVLMGGAHGSHYVFFLSC